jgi:uncharacterized protein (TIGR02266 family)
MSQPVRIRYRLFQEFIQEMSTNISLGGMFVATAEPREPGSQFDFEYVLEDGFTLIKGRAEVAWVRSEPEGDGRPVGMGVRFMELEETSRVLVGRIVDRMHKKGQSTFDVVGGAAPERRQKQSFVSRALVSKPTETESTSSSTSEVMTESAPETPADEEKTRTPRYFLLLLGAVVAGLLVVLAFNTLFVRPRIDDLERRLETLSRPASMKEEEAVVEMAGEEDAEPAVVIEEPVLDVRQPLDFVRAWALVWSEQRIEDYLQSYSTRFEPFVDLSRAEWENLRRVRIGRGVNLQVQVLLAEVVDLGPEERIVSFVQVYRSDTYNDRVRKILRLVWEQEGWKIIEERVVRPLPEPPPAE